MTSNVSFSDRTGQIVVLCAPSGTGKSTLVRALMKEFSRIGFSVSCTTRAPRTGEVDGRDYHFLTVERFLDMREAGGFAEWAEVHGNYYGTPVEPVRNMLAQGKDVLFDIDVQGAVQLMDVFPDGLYVFVLPPSRQELERRLRGRGTDEEVVIAKRMVNARKELEQAGQFGYHIVNDDLDQAVADLRTVYLAGGLRTAVRAGLTENLLEEWA